MSIRHQLPEGVMLNAYPDSCGGDLGAIVELLSSEDALGGAFSLFYVLPSLYNSDLDRGFSIVDYGINGDIATAADLHDLQALGIGLKLDFVANHISVQSPQFKDMLEKGDDSRYVDFFIDWNKFWAGQGEMGPDGYIIPRREHLEKLFMRKPELPILEVPFPDGTSRFYWNTFYQQVTIDPPPAGALATVAGLTEEDARAAAATIEACIANGDPIGEIDLGANNHHRSEILAHVRRSCTYYRGQMDLNASSDAVWEYYEQALRQLSDYGARIVRLDAFAYLHKAVGERNFFNEPGTWDYLDRLKVMAEEHELLLLPEIHSRYDEGTHRKLAGRGLAFYDFFFPGLVIDALERARTRFLAEWIREVSKNEYRTVNMLGCHDGIPLLDLQGLLDAGDIDEMIDLILARGGMVKNLYGPDGTKISYYQVNAAFFSALDENPDKLVLARAIQMFMPGLPQVWYLDLLAGTNDHEAAEVGGHKEINRTNLSMLDVRSKLSEPVVRAQLELLRFRNTFPAFGFDSQLTVRESDDSHLQLVWTKGEHTASLDADLGTLEFEIAFASGSEQGRLTVWS